MKGKGVIVFTILILAFSLSLNLQLNQVKIKVEASNGSPVHNLNTGLNYSSIQEAIDASETFSGHTIFIEEGIFYERISIGKSISLIGENRQNTIIDGENGGTVLCITASNVKVQDLTLRNGGDWPSAGIYLASVQGCWIHHNILKDNGDGIHLSYTDENLISDNIAFNNKNGIRFDFSAHNIIEPNV